MKPVGMVFGSFVARTVLMVLIAVGSNCMPAFGDGRTLSLLQPVLISEEPDKAVMIVSSRGQILAVVAGMVIRSANDKEFLVAGRVSVDRSIESISVLTAVVGRKGGVHSATQVVSDLEENRVTVLSARDLERDLAIRRKELSDVEQQLHRQGANLERLQTDADVIANVGRIVDAEDELGAVKSDYDRLTVSLAAARERLASLRALPAPTNYERREAEISGYLNEFSKAVQGAHGDVLQKVASAEEEMQKKVALIDATKNEHIDLLQKQLANLRRERETIERSRTVVVSPPPAQE